MGTLCAIALPKMNSTAILVRMDKSSDPKILFFGEAVTLAHVVRPMALAEAASKKGYQTFIAAADRWPAIRQTISPNSPMEFLPLDSITCQEFLKSLQTGSPPYSQATIQNYIRQDRALIEQIKPDVIVGDFRLSLQISARILKIPYVALTDFHWSPFFNHDSLPIPDRSQSLLKFLPVTWAGKVFNLLSPLFFTKFLKPFNQVRSQFGFETLGSVYDLYVDGDWTFFCDEAPIPAPLLPLKYQFLGPILWVPKIPPPSWPGRIPNKEKTIFISLGSSGKQDLATTMIDVSLRNGFDVMISSPRLAETFQNHPQVYWSEFIPIDWALKQVAIFVCNGGTLSTQQAIHFQTACICVPSNLDQFLNVREFSTRALSVTIRSDSFSEMKFAMALKTLATAASSKNPKSISEKNDGEAFVKLMDKIVKGQVDHAEN